MPFKNAEKRRDYRRRWYQKHNTSEKAHVRKRKRKIREWFNEYKKGLKCSICSESHPAVIDFHHKDSKEKELGISYMVADGYSVRTIRKELDKCKVVCANCHRKIHYDAKI